MGINMTENSICEQIRVRLYDHQNNLMTAHARIIPARQDVEHFERQVSDLKSQTRTADAAATSGQAARHATDPGGLAVTPKARAFKSCLSQLARRFSPGLRGALHKRRLDILLGRTGTHLRDAKDQLEEAKKSKGNRKPQ